MKKQILAALILTSLSAGAFALPQSAPQPLLGEAKASTLEDFSPLDPLAENGSERLQERLRIAEDGADRTTTPNRVAEGGAERLQQRLRVAEDGAERTKPNRVAEGGAERTGNQRIG